MVKNKTTLSTEHSTNTNFSSGHCELTLLAFKLVANWFEGMSEENKNSLLARLLDHCGPAQNHLFSLKITQPHSNCIPNCCDLVSYLPRLISIQIFSYLDPGKFSHLQRHTVTSWQKRFNLSGTPRTFRNKCGRYVMKKFLQNKDFWKIFRKNFFFRNSLFFYNVMLLKLGYHAMWLKIVL